MRAFVDSAHLPIPNLMRWIPLILIGFLLVTPAQAQSFASEIGIGLKMSENDGLNVGIRYRQLEILGGLLNFRYDWNELFLGGQYRIGLLRQDRFRVYGFGRIVLGSYVGDAKPTNVDRFPVSTISLVGGGSVELPLHKHTRTGGFVVSLELGSGMYQNWTKAWWPQFGLGLYYYFL